MRKLFLALAVVIPGLLLVPLAASAANSPAQIINCAGTPPWCFNPNPIQITAGSTVTWTNQDIEQHTVTAIDRSFSSDALNQNLLDPTNSIPAINYPASVPIESQIQTMAPGVALMNNLLEKGIQFPARATPRC